MSVKVGTGVAIVHKGRVLAGKRKSTFGNGLWTLPGGHVETTDKTLFFAAEREVMEETGLFCRVVSPDGVRQELFTTYNRLGDDRFYVTIYLLAILTGDIEVTHEDIVPLEPNKCEVWRWFNLDELEDIANKGDEYQKIWTPKALFDYLTSYPVRLITED